MPGIGFCGVCVCVWVFSIYSIRDFCGHFYVLFVIDDCFQALLGGGWGGVLKGGGKGGKSGRRGGRGVGEGGRGAGGV